MSSLIEKAKTLREIYDWISRNQIAIKRYDPDYETTKRYFDEMMEEKWVRLEDAKQALEELEQKVKNLETDRDNLLKSLHTCTQNLNSYAKELAELKQKLRARAKTKPTQTLQSVRGSGDISLAYKICKAEAKQKMG